MSFVGTRSNLIPDISKLVEASNLPVYTKYGHMLQRLLRRFRVPESQVFLLFFSAKRFHFKVRTLASHTDRDANRERDTQRHMETHRDT